MWSYLGPVWTAILCLLTYGLVDKVLKFNNALKAIRHYPGRRFLFSITVGAAKFIPFRIPYVNAGRFFLINRKYEDFREAGSDAFSFVTILPPTTTLFLADPSALRDVLGARDLFRKPVELYGALAFYGSNIVVSDGEEWKRFRKIANPAFSERNNKLVWEETQRIVLDLFENEWSHDKTIHVDNMVNVTVAIGLYVLSSAAFGQRISWQDEGTCPDGYDMSFKEAINEASHGLLIKAAMPGWLLRLDLTTSLRKTRVAFDNLERYMVAMIHERRSAQNADQRADLLGGLTDATEEGSQGYSALTDLEVISNTFVFLIAGHETTAHTLCFALALLALYPDEQEKLYEQTKSVLGDRDIPTYDNISSCTYALAVLFETLRLIPSAVGVPKYATEDTILHVEAANGDKVPVTVPRGAAVVIHLPGLHNNPKYWPEPDAFRPSRFLDPNWPRDAFVPFSSGPRSCIGRRFAEIEMIATLTLITLRYKFTVKEEPQFANETFEERKARLLSMTFLLTPTPTRVPLTFTRRE